MRQPQGVLLILALVMTSVVLAASLILGTIIIREVRLAAVSDKGITAFYASESAGEEAMYRLLKLGQSPASLNGTGTFGNGASWSRQAQEETSEFVFDYVGEDRRVEVNVFNKDAAVGEAGVESVAIYWSSGQIMEVEISEWDGVQLTQLAPAQFTCTSTPCDTAIVNDLTADKAYRLVIIARDAAITDLIVETYSANGAGGSLVPVTSPRTVYSTGEFGGAQQAVKLSLPVAPPWAVTP